MERGWVSSLDLKGKVFLWRVMVGAIPIASVIQKRRFIDGTSVQDVLMARRLEDVLLVLHKCQGMVESAQTDHFHLYWI